MKNLAVLGATGSIGKSTLNLVRKDPERFNVFSLMANSNVADMKSLVHEFSPDVVVMNESSAAKQLRENINVEVMEGLMDVCRCNRRTYRYSRCRYSRLCRFIVYIAGNRTWKQILWQTKKQLFVLGH